MNIETFLKCVEMLPPEKSVLIMGTHGIGKSQLVKKVAKKIRAKMNWEQEKFPVIDRRLSQMTEGDIIGLPYKVDVTEGAFKGEATRFAGADWFLRTCAEPCMLFLDEGNRATGEVIQASFQIALDHELNGNVMHPQSRVFMAVNDDATRYQVTDFDPAFLSRWWVVKLFPTFEEWYEWAKDESEDGGNIHKDILDFLNLHRSMLDPSDTAVNMEKDTDRRSWEHFSISYRANKLDELNMKSDADLNFLQQFASGFIGTQAAAGFAAYLKTADRYVTCTDVLDGFAENAERIEKLTITEFGALSNKIVEWMCENTLTQQQAENFGEFVKVLSPELAVAIWQDIAKHPAKTTANMKIFHPYVGDTLLVGVKNMPKATAK